MRSTKFLNESLERGERTSHLDSLYRTYWTELCRYIERQFGSGPPEPEEVVQAAFMRFAALDNPEEIDNPRAFLYTCSRNIVLDARRHDVVRSAIADDAAITQSGDEPANLDIERVLLGREQLALVERVVRNMETKRRRVFIMHIVHEMRYTEISHEMGLSEARIRQLMASALEQCQRALKQAASISDRERRP